MGIFGRIIDSITINDKAVEKYNARIELELKSTVMISPTPSNITEIISRMRVHNVKHGRNQKYFDILFNFDKNNSQISSHNDMVTIIKENAAAFINTYNDILKNPNEYKESLIQKYEYAIRLTKDFVVLSDYVSRFVRNYEDIKYNMAEIKRQHSLYINAWKCLDLRSLQFIDYKKESELIENLNEVIKTIPSKKYYDIPNQNGLKQTIKNHNDQFLANQKQNVLYLAREFEIVYKNVLENPYIFDKNLLCKYDECAMLGRHYPSTETEIKSFVTKFDNLKNDFEQLKLQFDLVEKARKCLNLISFGYIDEEKAREIEENLKNILKIISNKRYYVFPNENGLKQTIKNHNDRFLANKKQNVLYQAREFEIVYKNVLENPTGFDKNLLCKYEESAILGGYYPQIETEIKNFVRKFDILNNDYERILSQYALFEKCKKYRDFIGIAYIDENLARTRKESFNKIRSQVNGKHYYWFPDENEFNLIISEHNQNYLKHKREDVLLKAKEFLDVFEKAIKKPDAFEKSTLLQFEYDAFLADKYSTNEINIKKFAEQYNELKNNLGQIILQYYLYKETQKCCNFIDVGYIDNDIKKERESTLQAINSKISGKSYYPIVNVSELKEIINKHNYDYIENGIKNKIFDDINGKSLDKDQRRAIMCDDKTNLVVAGAGCGKTLTICGKLKFLIDILKIKPEEILLLSYSEKSVEDLSKKIEKIDKSLEARTFHSLGLEILKTVNEKTYVVENQYKNILEAFFEDEVENKDELRKTIINYYSLYPFSIQDKKVYENLGDCYKDLKSNDYTTLKNKITKLSNTRKKETNQKELVKSKEELIIANFYYLNGIKYEYEKPYEFYVGSQERRQYQPDFYLTDYGIYHEHYGVNKDGKAIQFKNDDALRYEESMRWKRTTHSEKKTKCIETYSYQFSNNTIFDELKKNLEYYGVKLNPIPTDEIWAKLKASEMFSIKSVVGAFVNLYKSRYTDATMFDVLKKSYFENSYDRQRAEYLLDICKEFYLFYKKKLCYTVKHDNNKTSIEEKIDFDDMILKSVKCLERTEQFKYKYVIVDEFQDISYSRMMFLNSIIKHGNSKLFVVGDDWQSIYRFSGSDIDIFVNISKYFGNSSRNFIKTTYRNSNQLIKIAESFIMANTEQVKKQLKATDSPESIENPVCIFKYKRDKSAAFLTAINEIYQKNPNAKVLILMRYNDDIDTILSKNIRTKNDTHVVVDNYESLDMEYKTIHSSKGLESDYVILINADNKRKNSFPSKIEDDKLLDLVLAKKGTFPYDEERRLFFVALTRTKNRCYILTPKDATSEFVLEIESKCKVVDMKDVKTEDYFIKCPCCTTGTLQKRKEGFFGCSNYPYCTYTATVESVKAYTNTDERSKVNGKCNICGCYLKKYTDSTGQSYLRCGNIRDHSAILRNRRM